MNRTILWAGCVAGLVLGCDSSSDGHGTVDVRVSGQSFARTGWPVEKDGETVAFHDGWEVGFKHIVVSVHAFRVAEGSRSTIAIDPSSYLVDVHQGDFALWKELSVGARRWSDVGYRFAAPSADAQVEGQLPQELVDTMKSEKLAMWIEGYGKKAGKTVTFAYAVPGEVVVTNCLNGRDKTDGIVVGEGRTNEVEITLHMDHLFWDDHDAEEPRLLFGPIAHAAGPDNHATLEDLAAQRLTDLRDETGEPLVDEEGVPIVFVPREELPDNNLRDYIIDTALTLGHFNGEGHCSYKVAF